MDETRATPRGAYRWPLIIIGMLVIHIAIIVSMAKFALSDPNFVVVRDMPADMQQVPERGD